MQSGSDNWIVYILRCADDTLYCGITTDVARRVAQHNKGTGAKYTRARLPVTLEYTSSKSMSQSKALQEEYRIKQLSREDKLHLCKMSAVARAVGIHD